MACRTRIAALLTLSLACASRALHAQTVELPATPAQPAASIFVLPKAQAGLAKTQVLAAPRGAPPTTPDTEEVCYAPAEGLYAPSPKTSPALQKQVERYNSVASQRVETMWLHDMPRAAMDPWFRRAKVTVRFAILPNGSIDPPLVTASSGRGSYDHHALEAIRQAGPFDPLPAGYGHPLVMCFTFGYHMESEDFKSKPVDPLPYPPAPASAKASDAKP